MFRVIPSPTTFQRAAKLAGIATWFAVAACHDGLVSPSVASIEVTSGPVTLHSVGQVVHLGAVVKDADGGVIPSPTLTWTSSDPAIVAISAPGEVTAVANGQATISATDGGAISGTVLVKVNQVVATVTVSPATPQLASLGEWVQMNATAKDSLGHIFDAGPVTWSSVQPTVTIDSTGLATAVSNGIADVQATIGGVNGSATISIAQVPVKLAFAAKPSTTQNAMTIPSVNVQVQDARGFVVASATNAVTIAIGSNPAGGALAGTTSVFAANGLAKFTTLAIDKVATGYSLSATSTGLASATSPAFEIMNVPARIDSIHVSTKSVKLNSVVVDTVWMVNGSGRTLTGTILQGVVVQGNGSVAAGGTMVLGCTGTPGDILPGTCKMAGGFSIPNAGLVPGPATLRMLFSEGNTLLWTFNIPVTIVP